LKLKQIAVVEKFDLCFKDIQSDVQDHNRPINNTLDLIEELVESGFDVLSQADLNQLKVDKN